MSVIKLKDNSLGEIIKEGRTQVSVPALSVLWLDEMDFERTDVSHNYLSYELLIDGRAESAGTVLFTAPKHFDFADPHLRYEINGDEITVFADAYAKYVEIDSTSCDMILSDNYFDMNAGKRTVKVLEGSPKDIVLRSVYDIK